MSTPMTTLRSTITDYAGKAAMLIGQIVLRLVLIFIAGGVLTVLGQGIGPAQDSGSTPMASPAPTAQASPAGGYVKGHLFSPDATLDASRIDDLRTDPYGQCVMQEGVLTPTGVCVDAVWVSRDEVGPEAWATLLDLGYMEDADAPDMMWIPLAMVTMDGEGGEITAVDLDAPLR
jgi:hypothetical protein